jgi:hypothetical protein
MTDRPDSTRSPADPSFVLERRDGMVCGPLRASRNSAIDIRGSIHDDQTAAELGFRGGTVAGSVHFDLFAPLLVEVLGRRWYERGTLSMYFRNPTVDRELVRAFTEEPPAGAEQAQVAIKIEREDGLLVGEGTASVGEPDDQTALGRRDLQPFPPGELRILAGVAPGEEIAEYELCVTEAEHADWLEFTTEPMDWYRGTSPWGGPLLTPYSEVTVLYPGTLLDLGSRVGAAVGLFGGIELRHFNGPLFVAQTYRVKGSILAVGQSPRTEYIWFDTEARDHDDRLVAGMRMQLRWMKASSELYRDGQ